MINSVCQIGDVFACIGFSGNPEWVVLVLRVIGKEKLEGIKIVSHGTQIIICEIGVGIN